MVNKANATHYVHRNTGNSVFVKEAAFFASQGGLTEEWGKAWTPIIAANLVAARLKANHMFKEKMTTRWQDIPTWCSSCQRAKYTQGSLCESCQIAVREA